MRTKFTLVLITWLFTQQLTAQRNCASFSYQQEQLQKDPSLAIQIEQADAFTRQYISNINNRSSRVLQGNVIKIPVVVHILYHDPSENISDAQVAKQIEILNQSYRRKNADTVNTPSRFAGVAADTEIEFQLATSTPQRKSTTGIIRKYTPVKYWKAADDQMKFSAQMGDDAWDSKSYLNIWVCNLRQVAGYSSVPGGPADKDGVVIGFNVFGLGVTGGFDLGRTAVHEVGHWLGIRHLWGDEYCGDDGIADTPKQEGYNQGCPTGIIKTCGNTTDGDMYMNYMDFTNDGCMNLFTKGQAQKMQALFVTGGARNSILNSFGLSAPLIIESPLPDESPKWLHPQLYPNPASTQMILDLSYDIRWIGKMLTIMNLQGQVIMQLPITSKTQIINIAKLQPGMFLLIGKKDDGETIKQKFIKL